MLAQLAAVKILFEETANDSNETQFDPHPLLSRQPKVGVSLSESE
jgi:hypothetical protein